MCHLRQLGAQNGLILERGERQRRRAGDDLQQVVEVVGDPAREPADRLELLRLPCLLGKPLLGGDVAHCRQPGGAALVHDRHGHPLDLDVLPVGAQDRRCHAPRGVLPDRLAHPLVGLRPEEVQWRPADQLGGRTAEDLHQPGVHVEHDAVGGDAEPAERDVEQRPVARLALGQLALGRDRGGAVVQQPDRADDAVLRRLVADHDEVEVAGAAVAVAHHHVLAEGRDRAAQQERHARVAEGRRVVGADQRCGLPDELLGLVAEQVRERRVDRADQTVAAVDDDRPELAGLEEAPVAVLLRPRDLPRGALVADVERNAADRHGLAAGVEHEVRLHAQPHPTAVRMADPQLADVAALAHGLVDQLGERGLVVRVAGTGRRAGREHVGRVEAEDLARALRDEERLAGLGGDLPDDAWQVVGELAVAALAELGEPPAALDAPQLQADPGHREGDSERPPAIGRDRELIGGRPGIDRQPVDDREADRQQPGQPTGEHQRTDHGVGEEQARRPAEVADQERSTQGERRQAGAHDHQPHRLTTRARQAHRRADASPQRLDPRTRLAVHLQRSMVTRARLAQ